MIRTEKNALDKISTISIHIENTLNETFKSNYTLCFVEVSNYKGFIYAHCTYMNKLRGGILQILIVYHINNGNCFIFSPINGMTTNDICDMIARAKIYNTPRNNIAIEFLDHDIGKIIDLTFLAMKESA